MGNEMTKTVHFNRNENNAVSCALVSQRCHLNNNRHRSNPFLGPNLRYRQLRVIPLLGELRWALNTLFMYFCSFHDHPRTMQLLSSSSATATSQQSLQHFFTFSSFTSLPIPTSRKLSLLRKACQDKRIGKPGKRDESRRNGSFR